MISLNYLMNPFPLYTISLNVNSIKLAFLIVGLVNFLLPRVSKNKKAIYRFFLHFFDQRSSVNSIHARNHNVKPPSIEKDHKIMEQSLCRGDLEIVFARLGMIFCRPDKETRPINSQKILNLFEEKNPSLDEVKQAFDVFDENKDGFLDSVELQRVLCALGFKEGLNLENCSRMINGVDEDGDGRLDFQEFVKFMESSSC